MNIEYVTGDLLNSAEKIILQGCNSKGVMGSGIALQIKQKYPEAFLKYQKYCDFYNSENINIVGDVVLYETDEVTIINAITQKNYGRYKENRYVSYDAIDDVMRYLNIAYAGKRVAMPMIGAGLGNGDWNVISAIIESRAKDFQPVVYRL